MRRASAALVPLLIAVMLVFWFIAFMGGNSDNLHAVNEVTNLQKLQEKLLIPAVRYRYKIYKESKEQGTPLTEAELDQKVDAYVHYMMIENKIEQ